jgi:hypothetical protein
VYVHVAENERLNNETVTYYDRGSSGIAAVSNKKGYRYLSIIVD